MTTVRLTLALGALLFTAALLALTLAGTALALLLAVRCGL
jgi:hypothetical protein